MNFIKNIFLLIVSPALGWKEIKKFKVPKELLLSRLYYPMLAILALTSFITFFYGEDLQLIDYLQKVICKVGVYFFGYMISSFILCSLLPTISNDKNGANKIHLFVIYCYAILMLFTIIENFIPVTITILDFLPFYLIFVIWKGVKYFNDEILSPKFLMMFSASILGVFYFLQFILNLVI